MMKNVFLAAAALVFSATAANAEVIAQFTSNIEERQPVDALEVITFDKEGLENIIFFTDIRNEEGKTIYHVWKNGENEIYKHKFNIGGARWRVWSSVAKLRFTPEDTISVEVVDDTGNILYSDSVEVK
ncbi:MAG: DUF2914 domain-containing protein [Lactobacillaceae bacterium]|jgi:hypothetical protein|nr:DUF2914 domain-containing protein [Lactobacillaceae bacterium]